MSPGVAVVTSVIALTIAIPVSFGIAIFLTELCPVWLKQPLGTAVRDAVRAPSAAFVRGRWIEDHSAGRSEQQRVPVE